MERKSCQQRTWVVVWYGVCGNIHVTNRLTNKQAIAYWVDSRLVGQVSYIVRCSSKWYREYSARYGG